VKTDAQQARLDRFMPGWRTDADDATLETLRVAVGALPVLASASAAGYDITADQVAGPLIQALRRHADDLAPQHRAALAAMVRMPDGRTRKPERQQPTLSERLRAVTVSNGAPEQVGRPAAAAKDPQVRRPSRNLVPPSPVGAHPLTGRWVRATKGAVSVEVFVVTVVESAAAVKAWTPTTGRSRLMPLADWNLVIVDDPRS
jgi:hypothetical protein